MVERKIKNMNLYVFERDGKPTDDFIQEVNEWVNLHKELQVIDWRTPARDRRECRG